MSSYQIFHTSTFFFRLSPGWSVPPASENFVITFARYTSQSCYLDCEWWLRWRDWCCNHGFWKSVLLNLGFGFSFGDYNWGICLTLKFVFALQFAHFAFVHNSLVLHQEFLCMALAQDVNKKSGDEQVKSWKYWGKIVIWWFNRSGNTVKGIQAQQGWSVIEIVFLWRIISTNLINLKFLELSESSRIDSDFLERSSGERILILGQKTTPAPRRRL